jgi:energy-coupling factor transport system ATP-binding protein
MDTSDEDKLIKIRRNVGMVFQNPDNQIVANVVEEDVAFGPENLGVASPAIRQRVDQALKQVGMYEYREHAPHLLSGGQKQRIAIAGVIAMQPKCIVLDEPTAMLDPKGRREVIETVKRLNAEKGITVVLITHHMDEAAQAQQVVILHKGQVAAQGTPEEVFSQVDMLHDIGLAAPETVELCWELNKEGFDLPLDQLNVEKCAQALYDAVKA